MSKFLEFPTTDNIKKVMSNIYNNIINPDFKDNRKDYYIEPKIVLIVDESYWSLLPTVFYEPWGYRYTGTIVLDIHWLIFHIGIGIWRMKDGVNRYEL